MGRKASDNPKDITFKFRMDKATYELMKSIAKEQNISNANVIRNGIEMQKG